MRPCTWFADPLAVVDPILGGAIDWEATLAYRRHLWSLGFGVAEAMDTSQRGMGLSVANARELIARSAAEAHASGATIASGVATDDLAAGSRRRSSRSKPRTSIKPRSSNTAAAESF